MASVHHAIDYVELTVADVPAAKQFYGEAFGWRFTDYGPEYAGIQAPAGDGEVGGITVGEAAGPGGPLVLLYSDDLDATLAAVTAAGGEIADEPYAFPGGRRFTFDDPSGNRLRGVERHLRRKRAGRLARPSTSQDARSGNGPA